MAFAPLALGIAGAATSAIGAIGSGASNAAQANYEAQVAANNAVTAGQNANYATAAGSQQTYNTGLQQRANAGQITTGFAADNIDVSSGSAAKVRTSQAELGEQAEETTSSNAALTAYGYRTQATNFTAQSQLEKAAAPLDILGGVASAGGTLLSSAGNLGKWAGFGATPAPATP